MSVAPTSFPAYSRARMESPVRPAVSKNAGSAEAAIASEADIRSGLTENLARLWRYGLVLSHQRDVADDLVQATCVRALERADQFIPGTRLDRWLFSILHSIWLNEIRSRRVRQGQGFVDARETLTFDGAHATETQVMAGQVLKRVNALPEAQRTVVFLAYVEGLSYREVASILDIPIGTVMSRLAAARARLSGEEREGGRQ
ncbi:RNA polymerase sigma factor, sigma-70 family [Rhizobium leguminosarum bv. trifolii WSM597]|uniref:RNA polymerase sigma factor, sigma-70 family n=1 Tax=Rhizobium leguminosarum bv. trifolii WSM597 TaxID=754764 RepID=J0H2B6_RHILT|nr:RNA polymerase sigma factor [Rhizobium leguminosarum]EJB04108.1 RNA polymerase sigma factor, sigma-70 family [Rhizobium leguminosarum bv. trifolii WSM597]